MLFVDIFRFFLRFIFLGLEFYLKLLLNNHYKGSCYFWDYITWDADVDNIVLSELIETKNNFGYLIGYLNETTRPLVLILRKTERIF